MPSIEEIAPDIYRISLFVPEINLQFNHFLVRDDEPLLYHAGMRRMFPLLREELAKVMDRRSSGGSASVISKRTNAER